MKRTITRLFDTRSEAEAAVRELEGTGISSTDISIIAPDRARQEGRSFAEDAGDRNEAAEGAGKGATAGGALGAGVGLLAGLGMLAIPGIGPVVAAGWLASTAAGAVAGAVAGGATGGILGALKDSGVDEREAHVYAEGVRRGGSLVSVRVDEDQAAEVEAALDARSGRDAASQGEVYRQEGWSSFDPLGADYGTGEGSLSNPRL